MKKLPIDFIKKAIEEKGGKLDKNWMCPTAKTKFLLACAQGHQFETTWDRVKAGHWCPYCSGNVVQERDVKNYIENKKGR